MNKHESLFENMRVLCPSVLNDIKKFWHEPVASYAKYIGANNVQTCSLPSIEAKKIFIDIVLENISEHINRDELKNEIERGLFMQSGQHSQLYLDGMNFNALILGLMSSYFNSHKHAIILNSSVITLHTKIGYGPAWINTLKDNVKIIPFGSSKLGGRSVCSMKSNIIKFPDLSSYILDEDEKYYLEKIKCFISEEPCKNLTDVFSEANNGLIRDIKNDIKPIILDERFCSQVLARHILNKDGIVYKMLFIDKHREVIVKIINKLKTEKYGEFLLGDTSFFWFVSDKKIIRMHLEDGRLIAKSNDNIYAEIEFNEIEISRSLKNGSIIPNIFLSYLVSSILPRIKVFGGTRMIGYYPILKKLLTSYLESLNDSSYNELYDELCLDNDYAWGARVIEDKIPPVKFLGSLKNKDKFPVIIERYQNLSLKEASQDLIMFKEHQIWGVYN